MTNYVACAHCGRHRAWDGKRAAYEWVAGERSVPTLASDF